MPKKHFDSIIHAVFHGKGGKRLYVYKNLHLNLFSIRCEGKVINHRDELILEDARFLVGKKGRERVLKEKRKNVHAGVSGFWAEEWEARSTMASYTPHKIYYNPYKTDSFVMMDDMKTKVNEAHFVKMNIRDGVFAFGIS